MQTASDRALIKPCQCGLLSVSPLGLALVWRTNPESKRSGIYHLVPVALSHPRAEQY